jgi:hypothetical protein
LANPSAPLGAGPSSPFGAGSASAGAHALHGTPAAHAHGEHAHNPNLQHHFYSMEQQLEASTFGMWVFLVTEKL